MPATVRAYGSLTRRNGSCSTAPNGAIPMTTTEKTKALVLFSGGQDSTVCLAWALARYDEVETVGFDYGQAHAVELD